MRKQRKSAVAAAVLALILRTAPALAQGPNGAALVVVVTTEPSGSLARRVRAALEGLGLDVIVLRPPSEGSPSRAPLEEAARNVGAVAAVRLVVSGEGRIEVWVADRLTNKAVVREIHVPPNGASDSTVALEAVELLRASLMELHAPEPPRGEVPVTPKLDALALPTKPVPWMPRLGLSVGAGAELGVRGLGPSPLATISLSARVSGGLGIRLLGWSSLAPSRTDTSSGHIEVQSQLVGVALHYELADPSATIVPSIDGGFALAHVATTGSATLPYVSTSDGAWFAAPVMGVGLAWSFVRGIRARADVLGAWAMPSADVRTPTATAGSWGSPALALSLAIEVLWSS